LRVIDSESLWIAARMYLKTDGEKIFLQRHLHFHVCYNRDIGDRSVRLWMWWLASHRGQQGKISFSHGGNNEECCLLGYEDPVWM
jgi:hypothetical protein